jgi:hypothetical protein
MIRKTEVTPVLLPDWDEPSWQHAETAAVDNARPESSDHRPTVHVRLLYDDSNIYGMFNVHDRYVRCVHTQAQDPVCRDSCVEFFFKPDIGPGYFNFEFNCGGALLSSYIRDHTRIGDAGFRDFTMLTQQECARVRVVSSLPSTTDPEIGDPVTWTLAFAIPVDLLEHYAGALSPLPGRCWTGNFYKCGDRTSHPHWISWVPVSELNFHLPDCFGDICLES